MKNITGIKKVFTIDNAWGVFHLGNPVFTVDKWVRKKIDKHNLDNTNCVLVFYDESIKIIKDGIIIEDEIILDLYKGD